MAAAASSDLREAARSQSDTRLSGQERGRSEKVGGMAPVYARLRSAMPIRQALVRLTQLSSGYDKMDEKGKANFDQSARGVLGCAICQTHYVVTMLQASNPTGQFVEEGILQGMTLEQSKIMFGSRRTMANDDRPSSSRPRKRAEKKPYFSLLAKMNRATF